MLWFFIILFLTSALNSLSEAGSLPSSVVIGTVSCDTCFEQSFTKKSHFIRGAIVSVECKDGKSRRTFHKKVKTDKHGVFKVHLPFSVSKHVQKIKTCSVVLLSNGGTFCAVASTATSSSPHLKSRKEGTYIFSAGFFSFKPQKQPDVCNQKPSILNSKEFNARKNSLPSVTSVPGFDNPIFPPPLQDPKTPDFPPRFPQLPPLPPLPSLPPLPGLPVLPPFPPLPGKDRTTTATEFSGSPKLSDQKNLNPETFLPTPPYLPPNPFQPPPLFPPILPPNPLQPPPSPLIPLPPIPGLTPSPPPPAFPFPLPPYPFLPYPPPIPGIPPASSSSTKATP